MIRVVKTLNSRRNSMENIKPTRRSEFIRRPFIDAPIVREMRAAEEEIPSVETRPSVLRKIGALVLAVLIGVPIGALLVVATMPGNPLVTLTVRGISCNARIVTFQFELNNGAIVDGFATVQFLSTDSQIDLERYLVPNHGTLGLSRAISLVGDCQPDAAYTMRLLAVSRP